MGQNQSLSSLIYDYTKVRIMLGFYRAGEQLLPFREIASMFCVSPSTVKTAFDKLEEEGLVKVTPALHTVVTFSPKPEEQKENRERYAAERRHAFADLKVSMPYFIPGFLKQGLSLCGEKDLEVLHSYIQKAAGGNVRYLSLFFCKIISKLENPICVRLYTQAESFYCAFYDGIMQREDGGGNGYQKLIHVCEEIIRRRKSGDYESVRRLLTWIFAETPPLYIGGDPRSNWAAPVSFSWETPAERPQIVSSVAADLIKKILIGIYRPGDYFPREQLLAKEYKTSLITVRRAIMVMTTMGIVKNIRGKGKGIQVLPIEEGKLLADYHNKQHIKNLITYLRAMQIIVMTCRSLAAVSLPYVKDKLKFDTQRLLDRAYRQKDLFLIMGVCISVIHYKNPSSATRMIYSNLAKLWIFGYSIRSLLPVSQVQINYAIQFSECLEDGDASRFSALFESLFRDVFQLSKDALLKMGISEVADLFIPCR